MNNEVVSAVRQNSERSIEIADSTGTEAVAALFALRLIIGEGMLVSEFGYPAATHSQSLKAMAMAELGNPSYGDRSPHSLQLMTQHMQRRLDELEAARPQLDGHMADAMAELTALFGLDANESTIVVLCLLLATYSWLDRIADQAWDLGNSDGLQTFRVISSAVGLSEKVVRKVLAGNATLRSSGLIMLTLYKRNHIDSKIALIRGLRTLVIEGRVTREEILAWYAHTCVSSTLQRNDYTHIEVEVSLLFAYLNRVTATPSKGINVLLYGPPGTGKTELARLMVKELEAYGVEIATEDHDGDPVKGTERLQYFRIVQRIAASQHRCLVIFDEAEDLFSDDESDHGSQGGTARWRKASINKSLETNSIPAIWITNHVKGMDPAFIRRFDLVIEVPLPPRHARTRMLTRAWGEHGASTQLIEKFSTVRALSPAIMATASRVAQATHANQDGAAVLTQVVAGHLQAVGVDVPGMRSVKNPLEFDLSLINCNVDPATLIKGLARTGAGRLLFDGLPGSGKSELARHITTALGLDVIDFGAAQLLAPYIGESERNIAGLFQRAARFGSAIILDEVDGLLMARATTSHSWEVTLVNEFLRQLEKFPGVLIATTNRLESIDAAAKRRFDVIAKFSPLKSAQLEALLNQVMQRWHGATHISELDVARIKELPELTLGEIAAAVRRCELFDDRRMSGLMTALMSDQPEIPIKSRVSSINRLQ